MASYETVFQNWVSKYYYWQAHVILARKQYEVNIDWNANEYNFTSY